jgi:glyoxylate reductase
MQKPSVYITRKLPDFIIDSLTAYVEVSMWNQEEIPVPADILLAEAERSDALFTMLSDKVDRNLIDHAPNLKVITNLAVGFDNIDVEYATSKGIAICNTPDVLTETTADLTFALLLAAARRLIEAAEFVKEGKWKSWSPYLLAGTDVFGKTIGIVGMGKIGSAVAKRAIGFNMDILYHNKHRNIAAEEELGATYASFETIVEKCDYIVNLTPLTDMTHHLFHAQTFKKMKRSAILINAGRGPVINEKDLYEALVAGEIAACGLDVFDEEPIGADHPLLTLKNVVAFPHIGSASVETRTTMMQLCVDNILAVLSGHKPKTLVNKKWIL